MQQLQNQYKLMQQQQQAAAAQKQNTTGSLCSAQSSQPYSTAQYSTQPTRTSPKFSSVPPTNPFKTEKLVQPPLTAPIPNCTKDMQLPTSVTHSNDLDVSEEDLQSLLSQKDLATTLAENLLKHFGSEDIDQVKEESQNPG